MAKKQTLVSLRITLLEQALTSGDTTALETFWQEAIERGTPLMESIEGDDEHSLVTFVWRDRGGTQNIVVFAGPASRDHPKDNQMMRLLDTDLWRGRTRYELICARSICSHQTIL